ncbi:MAG: hypothetical protein IIV57_04310, partial [Bacteroidaceae bacterium]|nr:hypothetical protein [Bacteroidaceae bacterium]
MTFPGGHTATGIFYEVNMDFSQRTKMVVGESPFEKVTGKKICIVGVGGVGGAGQFGMGLPVDHEHIPLALLPDKAQYLHLVVGLAVIVQRP